MINILKQLQDKCFKKFLIKDPGDSNLIAGEQIQRRDLIKLNKLFVTGSENKK